MNGYVRVRASQLIVGDVLRLDSDSTALISGIVERADGTLSICIDETGRPTRATSAPDEAWWIAQRSDEQPDADPTLRLVERGRDLAARGEYNAAVDVFDTVAPLRSDSGGTAGVGYVLLEMAELSITLGHLDHAGANGDAVPGQFSHPHRGDTPEDGVSLVG